MSSKEYDVLAYTDNFEVIVVDIGGVLEYGVHNTNTGVIEYRGSIFSNTINKLDELEDAYLSALSILDDNGRLNVEGKPYIATKEVIH